MKLTRTIILFITLFAGLFLILGTCDDHADPYEEGMHWDYSIECENGFVYKSLGNHRGTIQVLNSDGTPLKCGNKIY
jgi:hypothetical protein